MWRYVVRRLLLGAVTVVIITTVIFFLTHLIHGGYVENLVNAPNLGAQQRQALTHYYHLDQPLWQRYLSFLGDLLHGNLGYSEFYQEDVASVIVRHAGPTALLMGVSYLMTLLIAVPIGVVSAVRRHGRLDRAVTAFSFFGYSLPNYWFAAILIFVFALPHGSHGGFLPVGGTGNFNDPFDTLKHLLLPCLVLVVQQVAVYTRYVRSSMLQVLGEDYVRTARAKGLSEWRVIVHHAFRNSLLPLITLVGLDLPQLFVGAVITEFVFNYQGMGWTFVNAAGQRDTPTLVGIVIVLAILVVLGNLAADLLYTRADPRVTYETAR